MELTAAEKQLTQKTSKALREYGRGNPMKDFMDQDDIINALALLIKIIRRG